MQTDKMIYFQQNRNLMTKLHAAQMNFRRFFLSLLANENQYQSYMQDEYHDDYGKTFITSLQNLAAQFVQKIEIQLPKTIIQQVSVSDVPYHRLVW